MRDDELLAAMWRAFQAAEHVGHPDGPMAAILAVVRAHDGAALAQLGRWCLTESRGNDCSDIDGGSLQEKAIELGLLAYVTVAEPCGEGCACMDYYAGDEWPHDCLRETERAALKGAE